MRLLAVVVLVLAANSVAAQTRVVHVSNFGEDSPLCGERHAPCRTISQAVAHASTGDTVLVGPGIYGDLNRNGVIGELGEEKTPAGVFGCLICIRTRITVLSERGAAHTTIDARNLPLAAVDIRVDGGAAFGYAEQGFTVLGAHISAGSAGIVWGNRVIGATTGLSGGTAAQFYENEVTEAASFGIAVAGGRIVGNVFARNGAGMRVLVTAIVEENTFADNRGPGIIMDSVGSARVVRNLFIRNAGPGIQLSAFRPDEVNDIGIFSNDFIGNDPQGWCGIDNRSPGQLWATNNFWVGAADFGVAQQIACNGPSSTTHVDPPKAGPH